MQTLGCWQSASTFRVVANLLALFLCLPSPQALAEIAVSGIDGELKENVRLLLSLEKLKCDAQKWKVKHLFAESDREVDRALRALGYYHATTNKSLAFNKDCWKAEFDINPGQRVMVSAVDITIQGDARADPAFGKLLQKMPLKPGGPLHHGQYENIKKQIGSLALDLGYLNGGFIEKKLIVDKRNNTAQIKLTFDSGNRLYIGDVNIEQDVLEGDVVKKYLSIKSGDPYTSEQLAKTHNALAQSGYFEMVDIRSDLGNVQNRRVPVAIKLTPRKKAHYGFGIGYDTDIGPLLNASYINRRINRFGHYFTSNIDLSPVLSTAEVEYTIPLDSPTTDLFSFGGGLKREHTTTLESFSATLSARLKHAFANGWRQMLFLDYSYEDFKTASDQGKRGLLVAGGNWLRSVSDNLIRPTAGYRVELETKGSIENPISDTSFLQGYLSAIWLHKLPWDALFIGRTIQGATLVDQITGLPTSYRFFAGGINSVRGYAYKELGPKDVNGNVIGGKFLSVWSAEYEHPILDNWGVAAFIDTGNAFNLDNIEFNTGLGLGARWYSPVGPIRLDFAIPLNESTSSFQIHFSAGSRL